MSVSVPDTRGLSSVYKMPFFELGFFLMIGFADKFADGTDHLWAMLVHAFSSGIEINWCKL